MLNNTLVLLYNCNRRMGNQGDNQNNRFKMFDCLCFIHCDIVEVTMRFFPIYDYLVCLVYGEESSVSGTYILKGDNQSNQFKMFDCLCCIHCYILEVTMRFFQFMTIWFALSMEKKVMYLRGHVFLTQFLFVLVYSLRV